MLVAALALLLRLALNPCSTLNPRNHGPLPLELQRKARIEANQARLQSIGLLDVVHTIATAGARTHHPVSRAKGAARKAVGTLAPVRRCVSLADAMAAYCCASRQHWVWWLLVTVGVICSEEFKLPDIAQPLSAAHLAGRSEWQAMAHQTTTRTCGCFPWLMARQRVETDVSCVVRSCRTLGWCCW